MGGEEAREQRGEVGDAVGDRRRDAEAAARGAVGAADPLRRFGEIGQRAAGAVGEFLALFGGGEPPRGADEEAGAERGFQRGDAAADDLLGDAEAGGGGGEAAAIEGFQQGAEAFEVEDCQPPVDSVRRDCPIPLPGRGP